MLPGIADLLDIRERSVHREPHLGHDVRDDLEIRLVEDEEIDAVRLPTGGLTCAPDRPREMGDRLFPGCQSVHLHESHRGLRPRDFASVGEAGAAAAQSNRLEVRGVRKEGRRLDAPAFGDRSQDDRAGAIAEEDGCLHVAVIHESDSGPRRQRRGHGRPMRRATCDRRRP